MPTIGQTLKETREKQKISVDVAAKAVKVKTELLEDIEKDDFSGFAAPIYARGILRLYAGFLGLEPESLVEEYNKLNPRREQARPTQNAAESERGQLIERRRAMVISTVSKPSDLSPRGVAGLIAVAIFVGISIWYLSQIGSKPSQGVQPIAPRMTEAPKPVDSRHSPANPGGTSMPAPSSIVRGSVLPTPGFTNSSSPSVPGPLADDEEVVTPVAIPALEYNPDEDPAPLGPPSPESTGRP